MGTALGFVEFRELDSLGPKTLSADRFLFSSSFTETLLSSSSSNSVFEIASTVIGSLAAEAASGVAFPMALLAASAGVGVGLVCSKAIF